VVEAIIAISAGPVAGLVALVGSMVGAEP